MRSTRVTMAGALVLLGACVRAGAPPQAPAPDSVSIGYGTQPTSSVTGAVQSLTADSLKVQYGTMVEMLEGRIAGLQVLRLPNGQIQLRLRGTTSVNLSSEPLIVIDDQLISPDGINAALLSLTPSEVARIDVLKDAGSTAIYGSRGANGVIVITTKRGPR